MPWTPCDVHRSLLGCGARPRKSNPPIFYVLSSYNTDVPPILLPTCLDVGDGPIVAAALAAMSEASRIQTADRIAIGCSAPFATVAAFAFMKTAFARTIQLRNL